MKRPALLKNGEEQWEWYYSLATNESLVQYDYRSPTGELFSCIDKNQVAAQLRALKYFQLKKYEKLKHYIIESPK